MRPISFNDVSLKAKKNKSELLNTLSKTINSGIFLQGNQTLSLEKKLSKIFLNRFTLTVASGHDALLLSLLALQLSSTDEVLFPVNAYPTAFPIVLSGAKPVPIDVDNNGQINISEVTRQITKRTKVIVVVHMYGMTTAIHILQQIAKTHGIILIEDCAQAFGTLYDENPVGTFGDIACLSFYPTKNLGTLGDGGAIIVREKKIFNRLLQARSYGEDKKYNSIAISGHSRLSELHAGFLSLYLRSFSKEVKKRHRLYTYYLNKIITIPSLTPLYSHPSSNPAIHLFAVRAKNRNMLIRFLQKKHIPSFIHYPSPIHIVPAFSYLGYKKGDFKNAELLSEEVISLPFHPNLSKIQINYIIKNIEKFYLNK